MTVSENSRDANAIDDEAAVTSHDTANQATKAPGHSARTDTSPSASPQKQVHEEPQMSLEPDLPSDGRDAVGEAMIRDLPQRPELSEPPGQPHPLTQATQVT